jgi:methyl-accepting chemotaxis protein
MSAFNAGSIRGSLDLDTTRFEHGFQEAHTHAETEGGHIREILESLTEVFNEGLGPAAQQFGNTIRSVFAGFSEGPIIGVMGAIATAAGAVREAVEGAGGKFHQMGLEAEKAGVSAEFMSRLSAVGGTVGLSVDQLGLSFKLLEQRVGEAQQGSKDAVDGFAQLGISVEQAGNLAKNPQQLFEAVQSSLGRMTDATQRQIAAGELMGRQGSNLIPIFAMGREEFDKTADTMQRLGGTVSDSEVEMGESMGKLEGYFHAAMDGIEKAIAKPVLAFLEKHMNEIVPLLEETVNGLVDAIQVAWEVMSSIFETGGGAVSAVVPVFEEVAQVIRDLFVVAAAAAEAVVMRVTAALTELGKGPWKPEIEAIETVFHKIGEAIQRVIDKVRHLIDELHKLAALRHPFGSYFNSPDPAPPPAAETPDAPQPPPQAAEPAASGPVAPTPTPVTPAVHPAAHHPAPHAHHTAGGRENPGQQHHHADPHQPAAPHPTAHTPPPAPAAPSALDAAKPFKSHLDSLEGRLTDMRLGDDGKYHGQDESGAAVAWSADDYHRLQEAAIRRQRLGATSNDASEARRGVPADRGGTPDSIAQWHATHADVPDSIEKRNLSAQWRTQDGADKIAEYNRKHPTQTIAGGVLPQPTQAQTDEAIAAANAMPASSNAAYLASRAATGASDDLQRLIHPDAGPAVDPASGPAGPPAPIAVAQRPSAAPPTPPAAPVALANPPQPRTAPAGAPAAPAANQQTGEISAAADKVISAFANFEKSTGSTVIAVDALKTSFESLNARINAVTTGLTDSGRQAAQRSQTPASITQNITVAVQFDPRDSVNQFAAKVLPAIRDLKRSQDQQLAGAMAAQLTAAVTGGDE